MLKIFLACVSYMEFAINNLFQIMQSLLFLVCLLWRWASECMPLDLPPTSPPPSTDLTVLSSLDQLWKLSGSTPGKEQGHLGFQLSEP